jgi:hypothetical protein
MKDTLIKDILRYIVPTLKTKDSKKRNLAKERDELSLLELLAKKLDKEGKREIRNKKKISKDTALEEILKIVEDQETKQKHADYSLEIERESENESLKEYSVTIKYHEDDSEERIDIEIKPNKKAKEELKEENYVFSIAREKEPSEAKGHTIDIEYTGKYKKEHVTINYNIPLLNYEEKKEINKQDFSNLAANKWVDVFPESQMGGILGFTYLGDNYQALRADMLYSPLGKMVDLHEAIHTPDEHETRVLTEWMLDVKKPVYKK